MEIDLNLLSDKNIKRFVNNGNVAEGVPVLDGALSAEGTRLIYSNFNPGGDSSTDFGFNPSNDRDVDDFGLECTGGFEVFVLTRAQPGIEAEPGNWGGFFWPGCKQLQWKVIFLNAILRIPVTLGGDEGWSYDVVIIASLTSLPNRAKWDAGPSRRLMSGLGPERVL